MSHAAPNPGEPDGPIPDAEVRAALENVPAAVGYTVGPKHVLVWANARGLAGFGAVVGRGLAELIPLFAAGVNGDVADEVLRTGKPFVREDHRVRASSGDRWVNVRISRWEHGLQVWLDDVTTHVVALRKAEEQRDNLFQLFHQAPALIAVRAGPDFVGQYFSRAFYELLPGRDLVGTSLREGLPEARAQLPIHELIFQTGQVVRHDAARFQRSATDPHSPGQEVWLNLVYQPWRDADGQIIGTMTHGVDITPQVAARREAEAARARLEDLVATIDAIIWESPLDRSACNFMSGRVVEMFGWPADRWQEPGFWHSLLHPDERGWIEGRLGVDTEPSQFFEYRLRHADGRYLWVQDFVRVVLGPDGHARFRRGVIVDATARKEAEADRERLQGQMLQAQKLESLGVLAGGIAHDFNNLLTVILGNASLAALRLGDSHAARQPIDDVLNTAQRASDLTRQLLAYAGRARTSFQPLDLGAQVREIVTLLESTLPRKVHLHLDLARDLPLVDADTGQIQQVVMNLVMNGADAIEGGDGHVVIRTTARTVDRRLVDFVGDPPSPGRYVVLTVRDDGIGMDSATRDRIFDPFFTTKTTGRGLGLAAVAGIIRTHKGGLGIETAPGKGTEFSVWLPESTAKVVRPAAPVVADGPGRGRILLTEDEEIVRDTAKAMLEHLGYTVVEAVDGSECLRVYQEWGGDFAAILVDRSMPVMGGEEATRELLQLGCQVPVILSSGFPDPRADSDGPYAAFLQKPYTVRQLAAIVGRVVAGTKGP